jgi:hypothetical protein
MIYKIKKYESYLLWSNFYKEFLFNQSKCLEVMSQSEVSDVFECHQEMKLKCEILLHQYILYCSEIFCKWRNWFFILKR